MCSEKLRSREAADREAADREATDREAADKEMWTEPCCGSGSTFHFHTDPDPTFHLNVYPKPVFMQIRILVKVMRIYNTTQL